MEKINFFRNQNYFCKKLLLVLLIIIMIISIPTFGYKQNEEDGHQVHQYITSEAIDIWVNTPLEIRQHADNSVNTDTDDEDYQEENNDDIIDGSGEEDVPFTNVFRHFWQPDNPQNEEYDDGLLIGFESSYTRAERYWSDELMRFYIDENDKAQSYYWLGRIAHLLEDATVPAHVHLDAHPTVLGIGDDDILEEFTAGEGWYQEGVRNYQNFDGSNYVNKQYETKNITLPPNVKTNPSDLFKLFWYTAQRTQYFASDFTNGNINYVELDGTQRDFNPSLWEGENVVIVNNWTALIDDDLFDEGQDIANVASAMLPHAMKTVAVSMFFSIKNLEVVVL